MILQVATVAKAFNKPFYVATESYKFARLFPLTQASAHLRLSTVSREPIERL